MSSFKNKFNRSNNVKWVITFVLIAMLIVSVVFVFVKLNKDEKTKTLGANSFTYAIGLLDAEGEYEQGTSSIYMKDFVSVDGLTVEVDEDATVKYKVFFFNEDKEYIGSSDEDLSEDFAGTIPTDAEYFKIMITPTNDAEVSWTEIGTYAGMITVTVNK